MKVRELIEVLKNADQDAEVILQKDAEGNGYSPVAGVDCDAVYIPDSTWSGNVYSLWWSAEDAMMGDEEWEGIKSKPTSVILYPIN